MFRRLRCLEHLHPARRCPPRPDGPFLKAAKEVGFQPNVLARSLATGRSDIIALVTNAFGNPFINSVVDIFTDELQERRLVPLVLNLKEGFDWDKAVNLILQYQIDGVIIASSTVSEQFLEKISDQNTPIIQAFGRYLGSKDIDSVFVDNEKGGQLAARELLARGYRKPGFIGVPLTVSTTRDRLTGFREVLSQNGITPQVVHCDQYSYRESYRETQTLFRQHPELDCLFCADDLLGLGALDALKFELGRNVPNDVGVIGFNDIQATSWPSHSLATFRSDTDQIVVNAINMLTDRITNGSKGGERRIINCHFVERGSVCNRLE
ncbi:LacI family DNA-binding transcriptional regulator [Rhodobacteraceae bacterium]|nr:LacI family DNA-binding transcriptional regulator [Paracoccaceae bacterium]